MIVNEAIHEHFACTCFGRGLFALPLVPTASAEEGEKLKILILSPTTPEQRGCPPQFITGVSRYGEATVVRIEDANKYSIDQLRNFNIFVVSSSIYDRDDWPYSWKDLPELSSKLVSLVEEGKSMIVVARGSSSSPANAWVSNYDYETPDNFIKYRITPSDLTTGVRKIECKGDVTFIYGGNPWVLSPKYSGYPDPPGALAVYGTYGKGKYAVVSWELFDSDYCRGDVGTLFSNIMHWLTNREIPASLTLNEMTQKVYTINQTLNTLYSETQDIKKELEKTKQEAQNLPSVSKRIDEVEKRVENNEEQIGELSKEVTELKQQINELNKKIEEIEKNSPTETVVQHEKTPPKTEKSSKTCGVGLLALLPLVVLVSRKIKSK